MKLGRLVVLACALAFAPSMAVGLPGVSAADVPAPKSVTVAYGDGPVSQAAWNQRVRITFRGAAGDRVALDSEITGWTTTPNCEQVSLQGPGGLVAKRGDGFHRLPARGRYTFSYSQDCFVLGGATGFEEVRDAADLQLVKLRAVPLGVGDRVQLRERTGYVTAAAVKIGPRTPPLVLRRLGVTLSAINVATPGDQSAKVRTTPYGETRLFSEVVPLLLERGARMAVPPYPRSPLTRSGTYLFLDLEEEADLLLERLPVVRTVLDAQPVHVPVGTLKRVTFKGRQGQLVRMVASDRKGGASLNRGPGKVIPEVGDGTWQLPATGTYRLDLSRRHPGRWRVGMEAVRKGRGSSPATDRSRAR